MGFLWAILWLLSGGCSAAYLAARFDWFGLTKPDDRYGGSPQRKHDMAELWVGLISVGGFLSLVALAVFFPAKWIYDHNRPKDDSHG